MLNNLSFNYMLLFVCVAVLHCHEFYHNYFAELESHTLRIIFCVVAAEDIPGNNENSMFYWSWKFPPLGGNIATTVCCYVQHTQSQCSHKMNVKVFSVLFPSCLESHYLPQLLSLNRVWSRGSSGHRVLTLEQSFSREQPEPPESRLCSLRGLRCPAHQRASWASVLPGVAVRHPAPHVQCQPGDAVWQQHEYAESCDSTFFSIMITFFFFYSKSTFQLVKHWLQQVRW